MKTQKAVEDCRKSLNEELRNLYCLINIFSLIKQRRISGGGRGPHKILVGKAWRKKFTWKTQRQLERNYKIDFKELGWQHVNTLRTGDADLRL